MVAVILDPAEIRSFRAALAELRGDIYNHRLAMERETTEAQSFWRDELFKKFQREQEELLFQIQIFEKLCDNFDGFLGRKATVSEEYLRMR